MKKHGPDYLSWFSKIETFENRMPSNQINPPILAKWLLELLFTPQHDSIIGDLEEEYYDCLERKGWLLATAIYWLQTVKLIPSLFFLTLFWSLIMFKNYLTITMRTLLKYKSFSAINILGLALGMPVCLLIILSIIEQRSMDQFHENKDRIYRIITTAENKSSGDRHHFASAPAPLVQTLIDDYSGVEDAVQLVRFYAAGNYQDKVLDIGGFYADESFFNIFSFDLKAGDRDKALIEPFSAVISLETQKKFFGEENPLGKILSFSFGDVLITGVLNDLEPGQISHLNYDILLSFSTIRVLRDQGFQMVNPNDWNNHTSFYNYLLLTSNKASSQIEAAFPQIINRISNELSKHNYQFRLQSLTGIALGPTLYNHLGTVMDTEVLIIFIIVAIIMMLPAVFNYISLTMARSLKRAKEIGIRKVSGANRAQIIRQFVSESVVVALLSLIPAYVLLTLLLPVFRDFQFVEYMAVDWTSNYWVYLFFIAFSVVVGIFAGLLPAIYLSSMLPVQVLKGMSRIRGFSGLTIRKVLLIVQFTLSLFFILNTALIHKQVKFMLNADYGFDKENVISVGLQNTSYDLFRNELMNKADIIDVSAASSIIGRVYIKPNFSIQSKNLSEPIKAVEFSISENYLENLGFTLKAGRSFSKSFSTDPAQAIILNETAAQRLGFTNNRDAINQMIKVDGSANMQVVGIVQDFHYNRLHSAIEPVILRNNPAHYRYAMVRLQPGDITGRIDQVKSAWQDVSAGNEVLRYQFLDDYILGAYNDMRDIAVFLKIIAGLAIFIACLGLLGMAIFNTESRTKEIGIRKVLGASVGKIVMLLSKDMVKLLAIAIGIAATLDLLFITNVWMNQFPYREDIGPGLFVFGIGLVAALAFITIGTQTFRAASAKPVETLRNE